jgi:hypothetical protein
MIEKRPTSRLVFFHYFVVFSFPSEPLVYKDMPQQPTLLNERVN